MIEVCPGAPLHLLYQIEVAPVGRFLPVGPAVPLAAQLIPLNACRRDHLIPYRHKPSHTGFFQEFGVNIADESEEGVGPAKPTP